MRSTMIYTGIDAWDAAEIVADAIEETTDKHGCRATLGDRAPVVMMGRQLSRGFQRIGRFTFREVRDDDGELIGVEMAEVPQRMRSTLVSVAKDALASAKDT